MRAARGGGDNLKLNAAKPSKSKIRRCCTISPWQCWATIVTSIRQPRNMFFFFHRSIQVLQWCVFDILSYRTNRMGCRDPCVPIFTTNILGNLQLAHSNMKFSQLICVEHIKRTVTDPLAEYLQQIPLERMFIARYRRASNSNLS